VLARRRLVGDAPPITQSAAPRPHPLAILALANDHGVTRLRELRRSIDRSKRPALRAVGDIGTVHRDVERGCHALLDFLAGWIQHNRFSIKHSEGGDGGAASTGGRWEEDEPAYRYGHDLRGRPEYRGRASSEAEPDVRRDWESRYPDAPWDRARERIRDTWEDTTT
jgi:hypothetical protein